MCRFYINLFMIFAFDWAPKQNTAGQLPPYTMNKF